MLEIKRIHKTYYLKKAPPTHALVDVSLKFEKRGMVFILGKSGSGKSTFLNVVGGLDHYDSGEIIIKGKSSNEFTGSDFDSYRNTYLGFIFQEYNIIEEFTIGDNIALALQLQHKSASEQDVERILSQVDMQGYSKRMPNQISGGQRQRVAIARALIKEPEIIFADEPTGALDSATGEQIFQTLKKLSSDKLVIVVSHDREYAQTYGDRIIEFKDGKIISDMIKEKGVFSEQITIDGATVVDDVIKIPSNSKLTDAQTQLINQMLCSGDVVISKNKQLNLSFDAHFDLNTPKTKFVDTTEEKLNLNEPYSPFKLIKSRLPAKNARKMAISSMKHKKGRLIFSIILSIFAVMFFGFSNVLGSFNQRNVVGSVLRDYDYQYIAISRQIKKDMIIEQQTSPIGFEDNQVKRLGEAVNGAIAKFNSTYLSLPTYSGPASKYNHTYFSSYITGVVSGDLTKLDLPVPEVYGRLPTQVDEILITNYTAQHLLAMGMYYLDSTTQSEQTLESKDIASINDVLSYVIPFKNKYGSTMGLKIVGIVNFNIERYKDIMLNETLNKVSLALYNEFNERKSYELSYIYGLEGLSDYFYSDNFDPDVQVFYNMPSLYASSGYQPYVGASSLTTFLDYNYYGDYNFFPKDPSFTLTELKQDEVVINLNAFNNVMSMIDGSMYQYTIYSIQQMQQMVQDLGFFKDDFKLDATFTLGTLGFKIGETSNLKVVGVVSSTNFSYNNPVAIFNDAEFNNLTALARNDSYFVYLANNNVLNEVVKNFIGDYKINGNLYNSFTYHMPFSQIIAFISILFKLMSIIFMLLGIAFCVFSALLLLNFITTSVAYKKKEIGILRAIGARKGDVISIFLWEGFFIGLWIIAFATMLVFALVVVFNNLMSKYASVPFSLLSFGIGGILLMALVSFATIALASILPVSKITSKNPIDAIRG